MLAGSGGGARGCLCVRGLRGARPRRGAALQLPGRCAGGGLVRRRGRRVHASARRCGRYGSSTRRRRPRPRPGRLFLARAIATGSGEHTTPAVGYGNHTCVIAGPTRGVYCWGANDHGQIGNGKTGAVTIAEDVATATKVPLDETGWPSRDSRRSRSPRGTRAHARATSCSAGASVTPARRRSRHRRSGPIARGPRAIGNLDVTRIAANGPHTCAVKANGEARVLRPLDLQRARTRQPRRPRVHRANLLPLPGQREPQVRRAPSSRHPQRARRRSLRVASGEVHSCALAECRGPTAGARTLAASLVDPGTQVGRAHAAGGRDGYQRFSHRSTGSPRSRRRWQALVRAPRERGRDCWGTNDARQLGIIPMALSRSARSRGSRRGPTR